MNKTINLFVDSDRSTRDNIVNNSDIHFRQKIRIYLRQQVLTVPILNISASIIRAISRNEK